MKVNDLVETKTEQLADEFGGISGKIERISKTYCINELDGA